MTTYLDWDTVEDNIVEEFDNTGGTVAEYTTEPYLYGDVISQRRSGESRFFHFDGMGSTTALTDDSGGTTDTRAYSAFGEAIQSVGGTTFPFQYVGQRGYYWDSMTGHFVVRRRQYAPFIARWLSWDPLYDFSHFHSYSYALNSPIAATDPSGLNVIKENDQARCSCEEFKSTLGGPITITPDPFFRNPKFSACNIDIECKDDCDGFPGKAYPPDKAGFIKLCLSNKAQHRDTYNIIYEHELEHARQLCGGADISTCTGCLTWEAKAHALSCAIAFPKDAARQADCVKCAVYLSCKAKCKGKPNAPKKPAKRCESWADLGVILPEFPFPED